MSITSKDGLLAMCGSLIGLSAIAVSLRFYGRRQQRLRLLADDWTALIAVLTYVGTSVIVFLCVHLKFFGYSSLTSPGQGTTTLKAIGQMEVAFDVINTTTLGWVKLSAVFLIRRIFCTGVGKERINAASIATAVVIVICYTVWSFIGLFQCGTHFSAFWNGEFVKYCSLNIQWALGFAISDLILDIWVIILPLPRIWRLQATLAKRLSIMGVFLLAFVGLGASITRIVIFVELQQGGPAYQFTHDQKKEQTKLVYVQMLESGISVTAVNLPSLWLLCTSTIPKKLSNGLQSLQSLLSVAKHPEHNTSVSTTETNFSTSGVSHVFISAPKTESHIESQTQDVDGDEESSSNPLTDIYVRKSIEVR